METGEGFLFVKIKQRIRFYDQLSTMTRGGISLPTALQRLSSQFSGPEIAILSEVLESGARLNQAFAQAHFSPFEQHLVAAGEYGGKLDKIFKELSFYFQRELVILDAIKTALIYPIVAIHFVALIVPLPQLVLGSVGAYLLEVIAVLGLFYLLGFLIFWGIKKSWGQMAMQFFWLRFPWIGPSLRASYAYRWITALRLELEVGISYENAVVDAWRATGYSHCEERARQGRQLLQSGEPLSQVMCLWPELPVDWQEYIGTGEYSGKMNEALEIIENEAQATWLRSQERLILRLPFLLYFFLIVVASFVLFRQVYGYFQQIYEAFSAAGF